MAMIEAKRSMPPTWLINWTRTVTPVTMRMVPQGMALMAFPSSTALIRDKTAPIMKAPMPISSLKKTAPTIRITTPIMV